jgi:glutathione peroxidase
MAIHSKINKAKKIFIVLLMIIIVFSGYVIIVNRNAVNMTTRQKILKAIYPAIIWLNKVTGSNNSSLSHKQQPPPVSFYTLSGTLNNGKALTMGECRGKKILLVNTASDCGYTGQYEALEQLYKKYKDRLLVIGFPANDFKEQEKGSDEDIAHFCKVNFGVSFPLMKKSVVIKNEQQSPIFQWLSDPAKNGWNKEAPSWNFCKYLINEEGVLTHYFESGVEPLSKTVIDAIESK